MTTKTPLNRLEALDTNTISDALDFLGLKGATCGLRPLWDCGPVVGRASTVQLGPKADAAPEVHLITPVIDAATTDDRVIIVAGGIDGVSCWGDIIANAAQVKNIRGTIIDGMSRDIDGSRDIGFPVYGRGITMISARNRVVQYDSGTPLQIQDVTVNQDDYVIADNCGTVFVPAADIDRVLGAAERIHNRQEGMLRSVRAGKPVSEVMHDRQFEAVQDQDAPTQALDVKVQAEEDQSLIACFSDLDTPSVSDAMDKLGIPGQVTGIVPLTICDNKTAKTKRKVTVGPAFTVRYVSADNPPGNVGDFIEDVAPGDVIVIDNGRRTDCTVWGDIMTQYAGLRGIAGTVIDGVCRDVDRAVTDGYPLFTVGRWMRTGKDRVQVAAINDPVTVGNIRVNPRDIIVADSNGVVVVPRRRAVEVAEVATQIEKTEEEIRKFIAQGMSLKEARERLRYHTLQRRE